MRQPDPSGPEPTTGADIENPDQDERETPDEPDPGIGDGWVLA